MKTDFSEIQFDADKHRYYLNGTELTGVTAKLKSLEKPFDRQGNAQRVAQREGRSVGAILADWDAKAEKSRQLGIAVHQHIKQTLCGENGYSSDPFLSLNTKPAECVAFNTFWSQLAPQVQYSKVCIEFIVGDKELGIAGTVDAIFFSPVTGLHHIWDWKTGKFELENRFANLLPPFDDLEASKFNIYSLQVSAYHLIVERNAPFVLGDSYLVHLQIGHQVYKALDLRSRLLDWLRS